jgi:flagellar biosynthetic protein FliQ
MDPIGQAVFVSQKTLVITLLLSAPLLLAGLVVGVLVSLFQAVTQIHEMTLTFIPKIVAVMLVLLLLLPWMLEQSIAFSTWIFQEMPRFFVR